MRLTVVEALLCGSPWAHLHVVGMLRLMLKTKLAHSYLFCFCVCFCLYGPFNCISFHKFSRQLSAFSLSSPGLISALLVLLTIYLFVKVSLIPDIVLCGWLGLKHQLTNNCSLSASSFPTNSLFQFVCLFFSQEILFRYWLPNVTCSMKIDT